MEKIGRLRMDKFKKLLPTLVFNIVETLIIFLCGLALNLEIKYVLVIMLTFMISRGFFGKALHFKDWYRCLIWSLLILLSLFVLLKVDLIISILFAIFSAFIMTGKSNIKDMYLWTGKVSKYDALKNFIAISPNHPILLEHEEYWRKNYPMRYEIFVLYFRENQTYEYIAKLKGFDDNTITKRECATIYSILERPLGLPPVER